MFDSIISKRRSGKSVHQDFLESLIQKHTKNDWGEDQDDKLMDKQLKDNILTLLVAGHDTTTTALTWLIKFIAENPDVLERLRVISVLCITKNIRLLLLEMTNFILIFQKEHTEILDNRKTGSSLTWSEVTNMPYTTKVRTKTVIFSYGVKISVIFSYINIVNSSKYQVISETLRMATILPWYSRKAAQDFQIT